MNESSEWQEWIEKYKPVTDSDGSPRFFETYGEEFEFVKSHDFHFIWTETESEGQSWLRLGYHKVNRMGYYITTVPWTEDDGGFDMYDGYIMGEGRYDWEEADEEEEEDEEN